MYGIMISLADVATSLSPWKAQSCVESSRDVRNAWVLVYLQLPMAFPDEELDGGEVFLA
jgi:hypothetical protein